MPVNTDRYEVPDLVIDPPDGPTATWYPNVKVIVLVHRGEQFTLTPAEIRAVYDWVRLNELT